MNSEDFIDGGLTVDDMLQIARLLEEAGIDAIELSGGTADEASQFKPVRRGRLPSEEKEVFYRDAAKRYKETINGAADLGWWHPVLLGCRRVDR